MITSLLAHRRRVLPEEWGPNPGTPSSQFPASRGGTFSLLPWLKACIISGWRCAGIQGIMPLVVVFPLRGRV